MPNPTLYTDALSTFTQKYGLKDYDYAELATVQEKFSYMDEFILNTPTGRGPAGLFTALAAKTASLYFKNATELNAEGKYMSSFNIGDFLKDFDDLAQAKYESELEEGQKSTREKFAGADMKQISRALAKDYAKTNKTLPTLWFERLDSKKMSVDQIQGITNNAIDNLFAENADMNEMQGQLVNVVAAHEAMRQLRESRSGFIGFFWKLFHRDLNAQEEEYMNSLTDTVNELKNSGYDVDKVRNELTSKTVMGKSVKGEAKAKKAAAVKTSPAKSQKKPEKIAPVSAKVESRKDKGEHQDELANELFNKFSKKVPLPEANVRYHIEKIALPRQLKNVTELNESFDEKIASGKDPKKAFEVVVRNVFKECVSSTSYLVNDKKDKMEVASIMAKGVIENFTAAAFYPNELGSLTDTYLQQNVDLYNRCVESGEDFREAVDELNDALENDNRERVFGDGNAFDESFEEKSDRVDNTKTHESPSLRGKK